MLCDHSWQASGEKHQFETLISITLMHPLLAGEFEKQWMRRSIHELIPLPHSGINCPGVGATRSRVTGNAPAACACEIVVKGFAEKL
jgi:hypothetical protein